MLARLAVAPSGAHEYAAPNGRSNGIMMRRLLAPSCALAALLALPPLVLDAAEPTRASAQVPVTADVVAARVQAFYDQTQTVQARFQQHFWSRVYSRTQSSRGRLAIRRPGQVRFDYDAPSGKVLVSDGRQWTMYEPIEGTAGQYAQGDAAAASASALGFLTGSARITDFTRTLRAPSATQPAHTDALELRPRRPDPHYTRIVVYVDNDPGALGVVRRVSIEDADGNWNRFDFSDLRFNRDLPASTFAFAPPAGAHELSATAPR